MNLRLASKSEIADPLWIKPGWQAGNGGMAQHLMELSAVFCIAVKRVNKNVKYEQNFVHIKRFFYS
jgi:hypothetical protein